VLRCPPCCEARPERFGLPEVGRRRVPAHSDIFQLLASTLQPPGTCLRDIGRKSISSQGPRLLSHYQIRACRGDVQAVRRALSDQPCQRECTSSSPGPRSVGARGQCVVPVHLRGWCHLRVQTGLVLADRCVPGRALDLLNAAKHATGSSADNHPPVDGPGSERQKNAITKTTQGPDDERRDPLEDL